MSKGDYEKNENASRIRHGDPTMASAADEAIMAWMLDAMKARLEYTSESIVVRP